jgi:DICT domain-containing protein
MTYNFDPDKWYDDEWHILRTKLKQGRLTREEYNRALADLDRRLADMWNRLDGTYQVIRD